MLCLYSVLTECYEVGAIVNPILQRENGKVERLSHRPKVTQLASVEQGCALRQSDFRIDIWNNSLPCGRAGGVALEQGFGPGRQLPWGISAFEEFIFIPLLPSSQGCFGNEQGQYPTGKKKWMTHVEEGGGGRTLSSHKDTIFHTGGGHWMHHRREMDLRGHMDNSPTFGEDAPLPEKWFKRILAAARGLGYLCWTAPRSICFIKLTRCPV